MPLKLSELDRAYIAGLFDGEGCIHIQRCTRGLVPTISLTMTHFETVFWLHNTLSGRLHIEQSSKPNWANRAKWYLQGEAAVEFIREILPYMKTKLAEAQIFALWPAYPACTRKGSTKLPPDVRERRDQLATDLVMAKRSYKQYAVETGK